MTDVDFYTLAQQTLEDRLRFACRLTEKSINAGHQVLLLVDTPEQAQQLDQLLWSFREDAFIPHCLLSESNEHPDCRVHISLGDEIGQHHDVLICLSTQLPPTFSRFKRLLEVVVQEDEVLSYTRKHYKFLQDRGFPIRHHDMRT